MSRLHPGMPGTTVRHSNEIFADGRVGLHLTVPPETFEEFRQGYRCIVCFASQEAVGPFPEKCIEPYCNFNLKRDQLARLQFEDRGEEDLWPTRTESDIWTPG